MNTAYDRKMPVAVCDSQPILIEGLRNVLANSASFRLLEPVRSLDELAHLIITRSPRIALLDRAMADQGLTDWIQQMRTRTQTGLIVWAINISDPEALRLLQAGAKGIMRKCARPEQLISCFEAVANGNTWMDDSLFRGSGLRIPESNLRSELTPREQQVLELVERGMRNKEIAAALGIRPGTVKIHLKHIFEKSGIRGRYGLALSGLRERIGESTITL